MFRRNYYAFENTSVIDQSADVFREHIAAIRNSQSGFGKHCKGDVL